MRVKYSALAQLEAQTGAANEGRRIDHMINIMLQPVTPKGHCTVCRLRVCNECLGCACKGMTCNKEAHELGTVRITS